MIEDSNFHALVVDDEHNVRRLVSRALAEEGITADPAADGAEALDQFDAARHDLVIVDLRMPKVHGHGLVVDLLSRDRAPEVFVLTSVAEPRLVKDLLVRGVQDVDIKPVDFKTFAAKIASKMNALRLAGASAGKGVTNENEVSDADTLDEAESLDTIEQIESFLISEMVHLPPEILADLISLQPNDDIEIPGEVREFVARLAKTSPYARQERRQVNRVGALFPLVAVAYDDSFNQVGEPFHAFLRDASPLGVGIVALRPVHEKYLGLSWSSTAGKGIRTFMEVLRCRGHQKFYDIGGQFLHDL